MRLSYLGQDRLDLAEKAKHLAQRMSEPRDFDFVPLKRAARYLVGKPKAALRYRRQKHDDKITVFVDSDFAGEQVSRKNTTGLVAQIGNHTVKSGSTLQNLTTASSVGEAEFYAVVKGGQVELSLRSMYQDLRIPMKIEIQSDSSTANSLTDRLGAGQRTKHIDTWYFSIQERVQDGDLSIKKVPTAKNCADVGTKPSLCFSTTTTLQVCRIGIPLTTDPTLHYKMKVMSLLVTRLQTRREHRDPGEARAQKQTVDSVDRDHGDGCAS